jgi:Domain of unknown function (DUF6362)
VTEIHWTPRLVEAFLAEAADTMRRLPVPSVPGYFNTWPEIVQEAWVADGWAEGPTRLGPASALAITQMDETVLWLRWLDRADQRILWERANGRPWKLIAHAFGIDRSTAWRRWTYGLITIAARLNAQSVATPSQHQHVQHPP